MLTRPMRYGSDREQPSTSCRHRTGHLPSVVTTINPSDVVRDVGVLFDSELTMKKYIAKVAAVCFFHVRRLRQIRRVGKDVNHPPCVGFDNAAVGQLQVATRCSRACRSRLLSRYRECRTSLLGLCLTYVIVTMSPSSDATALAACQFTSAV